MTGYPKKFFALSFFLILSTSAALMSYQHMGNIYMNSLAVVACNVESLETPGRVPGIIDLVNISGVPDVVLLQGVRGEAEVSFLAENLGFPYYSYTDYRGDEQGLAILSNRLILNSRPYFFSKSQKGHGALSADLIVNSRKIRLVNLYLDRMGQENKSEKVALDKFFGLLNAELFGDTVRSCSVAELLHWLDSADTAQMIVGGDFNSIPFSRTVRTMNKDLRDSMWPSFECFKGTSKESGSPVNLRTDYVFHSPDMTCVEAFVIDKPFGRHYPVIAVFSVN